MLLAKIMVFGNFIMGYVCKPVVGRTFTHFLTNKHFKYYTGEFNKITSKYGLKLKGKWNVESMEHSGRHAKAYHDWALKKLQDIDSLASGNKEKFLELFKKNIANKVRNNPGMLKKDFWPK